ncbi:hypothetical protein DRN98_05845 [Methanosarcinales archaeon]|nr:MAG: hypothetical protein DRN98_05845 [Methanosarcinales archaeon]
MAIPLDRPVRLGKPMADEELLRVSARYGGGSVPYRDAKELWELTGRILKQHVEGGFDPEKVEKK